MIGISPGYRAVFTYMNIQTTYVNLIEIEICEVNNPEAELTARL
jgi:hypothetical protein